jgi:hypothetical protein
MSFLKTKSPINSILFILKSHKGLNKDYPEVLEIIESYVETEKKEIINAYNKGYDINSLCSFPDSEKYYNETFEK